MLEGEGDWKPSTAGFAFSRIRGDPMTNTLGICNLRDLGPQYPGSSVGRRRQRQR